MIHIGRARPEVAPYLLNEQVCPQTGVPHIQIHQGDALVVELTDDEIHVLAVLGVLVEQPVDPEGDAHVWAAVIVKEGVGQLAELPCLVFRQGLRCF